MSFWNKLKKPNNDYSNLHDAVEAGNLASVKDLLDGGANVLAPDSRGATPLHIAAARGHFEIAELLISRGASVDFLIAEGGTPLMAACSQARPKLVKLLISKGAQANKKGHNGRSPLKCVFHPNVAMVAEQLECLRILVDHGAGINDPTDDGSTPLMGAAWFGLREGVDELLRLGADATLRDSHGRTAAMIAFEREHDDLALLLKQHAEKQ